MEEKEGWEEVLGRPRLCKGLGKRLCGRKECSFCALRAPSELLTPQQQSSSAPHMRSPLTTDAFMQNALVPLPYAK